MKKIFENWKRFINEDKENKELKKQVEELKKENTELNEFRYLYGSVISRINKLEDDTRAAIEFNEDVLHDDTATLMILKFCDDITKLVGE